MKKDIEKECDRLAYALSLIEALADHADDDPRNIVENALKIMEFGNLTPKQMLDYIDAVR